MTVSYIIQITPSDDVQSQALGILLEQFRQQVNALLDARNWDGCTGTRIRYRQLDLCAQEWTEGWFVRDIDPSPLEFTPQRHGPTNLQVLGSIPQTPFKPRARKLPRVRKRPQQQPTPESSRVEDRGIMTSSQRDRILAESSVPFAHLGSCSVNDDYFTPQSPPYHARPTTRTHIKEDPLAGPTQQPPLRPFTDTFESPSPPLGSEGQPRILEWLGMLSEGASSISLGKRSEGSWADNDDIHEQDNRTQGLEKELSKHENGGCCCLPTFA